VGCPGKGYSFRNCEGVVLCSEGNCSELNIDFAGKKLIWEKEEIVEIVYPIDIPFEEIPFEVFPLNPYLIAGTSCLWANLLYCDNVIIINSQEDLENYVTCSNGDIFEIDFPKYTLLHFKGSSPCSPPCITRTQLQQTSSNKYSWYIDYHPGYLLSPGIWKILIKVPKLSQDAIISTVVTNVLH